jgi:flagellar biosynthesis/type III secretory pathway protein FliH
MVSEEDKERIRDEMSDFESLHDANPFVQKRMVKARAEGLAEGEAKGRAEGEAKGLQEAAVFAVELRFPTLLELAHQKAERVKEPEVLKFVLRGLKAAPNEEAARLLLDTLAA